jgi:cysteine desulfurase
MIQEIFLDNNATTQPLACVREAVLDALGNGFGNPSSANSFGMRARTQITQARRSLADILKASEEQVLFTSGATEANNWVLNHAVLIQPGGRIVTSAVEHSSVLRTVDCLEQQGVEVVRLPVDSVGLVKMDDLSAAVTSDTALVSIQWVNNETGVQQPIEEIQAHCQRSGVLFHSDAAQAVGKVSVDLQRTPVDFLSLTAHKFHGPQGVGALICRRPRSVIPQLHGGSQEFGLRAGTENVPGIVGAGAAAELRFRQFLAVTAKLQSLRDRFETKVLASVPDVHVNGSVSSRVCNTTNLCFEGVDGDALVARLDQQGVQCSQSSACTSQRPEPSYVLRAMGLSEEQAWSSLRFSFSELNTEAEVDSAVEVLVKLVRQLRNFSGQIRSADEHHTEVA